LAAVAAAALTPQVAAQTGSITGIVRDSSTGALLDGAQISAYRDASLRATVETDAGGRFAFSLPPGDYELHVLRLGYHAAVVESVRVEPGRARAVTISVVPQALALSPVVISASRRREAALDAPASVAVLDRSAIQHRPSLTMVDHVAQVAGVDFVRSGLTQREVVLRGFSNIASGALLVLTDYRHAAVPSLRINVYSAIPLTDDDVDRIEIVRGPGSAVYGPNSADGVLHVITRSPLDAPGRELTVSAGDRGLFNPSFRFSGPLSERLGLKVSGQYLRGNEWVYTDPIEVSNRAVAIARGADPDTLRIGRRDSVVERTAGEAQLEWRPGNRWRWTTSLGVNYAARLLQMSPLGAAQVGDSPYWYLQTRVSRNRLFAQAFVNTNDAGTTYLVRTGDPAKDRSIEFAAQVQHGLTVLGRVALTYGLDVQRTVPRTDGTITGRNEADDEINELGAYAYAEAPLARPLLLTAALRVDRHNRLPDPVLSPRAALVFRPGRQHAFRVAYNRAFSTPSTNNLFLDLRGGTLPTPIPMDVRLVGVPLTGFSFRRDCAGDLCMHSPYAPEALGGAGAALPLDATLLWPTMVDSLVGRGINLAGVPAPTAAEVESRLQRLDIATERFIPVAGQDDIPALRPTITSAIEAGYRVIAGDFDLDVAGYYGWKADFVSAEQVETPSVFLEPASLEAYLARYLPADSAQFLAGLLAQVPLGTVTPVEARDPFDILVSYRNFGRLTYWGADANLAAQLTSMLAIRVGYAWTSRTSFPVVTAAGPDTLMLNAPRHRGTLAATYGDPVGGLMVELRGRAIERFAMRSGVYRGTVPAYAVFDGTATYRLPFMPMITVTLAALNLMDHRHREFIGAPEIGRLVSFSARAMF
jgi:iron complex outermembrane receptor protein